MQGSTSIRPLLVAVALAFAGPAIAQSADKDASTPAKQSSAKPSATKGAAASKRLDFVPSNAVKQTTTRPANAQPANAPTKQDWHCDHSQANDA
jgi:hypothetical protein